MRTLGFLIVVCVAVAAVSCFGGDGAAEKPTCDEVMAKMDECYPGQVANWECTEETIKAYEDNDLDKGCDEIYKTGKADTFAFGGCAADEHTCGLIFCCKNEHLITWFPSASDWNFLPAVLEYQQAMPADIAAAIGAATREDLAAGIGHTWEQDIDVSGAGEVKDMAVEYTSGLIEVPYETFVQRLAPQDWGVQLAHYLGGEVKVYSEDKDGRAVTQLERMVLSPFPCDWETPLTDMDMTKVEYIEYTETAATVYWRVMYSDNDSTEEDLGSVSFRAYDAFSTVVTFHSAHRLNAPLGIHLPNPFVRLTLIDFFQGHIWHYGELVGSR